MLKRLFILSVFLPTVLLAQDFYEPFDDDEMVYDEEYELDAYAQDDEELCYYPEDDYFYMCEPYNADCDEMWYWEDDATYPTKRDNSWVDELQKPW